MSSVSSEFGPLDARSAECKELLERVIHSRELKRALRLRELLCYVGKRAHESPSVVLREQEIGAAVFGRPEDYDTGLDNIVRVNVSELRKRLAHYFQDEGADETIVMEIPRGGYLPIFLPRALVAEESDTDASPVSVRAHSAGSDPVAAHATATDVSRNHLLPLWSILILALVACGLLVWQNHQLAVQLQPWKIDPVLASFWSDFFSPGQEVDIVAADTSFALEEDILGQSISLDDYLDYKYKSVTDQPGLSPDKRSALQMVLDRNNGSMGDFQAAELIMELDGHSSALKLASARSYTAESIKGSNVILIGGRESNPWVDLYKDRMNFFMEYEPGTKRSYVANRKPQAGEMPVYEAPQDRNRSYSVVAFLPNPGHHGDALIIAGTDSQATRAGAEFVTSAEGLAQIRQKMPTGRFPYFEVVLSSARLVGTTMRTEIVATRVYER